MLCSYLLEIFGFGTSVESIKYYLLINSIFISSFFLLSFCTRTFVWIGAACANFKSKNDIFPRVFIFVSLCARFIYMRTHLHADNSSNRIERNENSGCRNFQEIWYKEASNTIEMKSTQTHSRTQLLHTTLHRNNSFFNWNHWTVAKFKSHSNCRRNACITQKYLIHTSLCYDITSICTHVLLQGQRVRVRFEYEFHALCNTKPLYVYISFRKSCELLIFILSVREIAGIDLFCKWLQHRFFFVFNDSFLQFWVLRCWVTFRGNDSHSFSLFHLYSCRVTKLFFKEI